MFSPSIGLYEHGSAIPQSRHTPVKMYQPGIWRFFRITSCYVRMYCAARYISQLRPSQRPLSHSSHSGTRELPHYFSPLRTAPSSHVSAKRPAYPWYSPAASISSSSLPPDKQLETRARTDGGWHFYNQDRYGPDN